MIDLRDTIVCVSEEEGCALGEQMVRKRFTHALSVGFRNTTIRIQMQSILSRNISDIQLFEELRKIVNCEKEHELKTGTGAAGKTKVVVNAIETDEVNADPQIAKLLTELKNLKLQVNHISGSGNRRNQVEDVSEVSQVLMELN